MQFSAERQEKCTAWRVRDAHNLLSDIDARIISRRRQRREKRSMQFNSHTRQRDVAETEVGQQASTEDVQKRANVENRVEAGVDPILLEMLTKRGVMLSGAMRLLVGKTTEELAAVQDYVDYWDSIRAEKQPGLLVSLIQRGDPLPSSFETGRQRKIRQEAEERRQRISAVKERLTTAYADYRRNAIDNFIIADLGTEEFEQRVDAYKKDLAGQGGVWEQMSPTLADKMARSTIQAEIAKTLPIVSFEGFREREIPQYLADFELSAADFGLEALPTTPDTSARITPNTLYAPESNDPTKDEVPPSSEENSSLGAI